MQWLLAIASLFTVGGVAEAGTDAWSGSWRWGPHMMFGFPGGMFMMVLMILAVAVLVYLALRKQPGFGPAEFSRETPLEVAKRRYAKGEISKEEFEEMKKDLS